MRTRRLISLMLALVLCISLAGVPSAFAADEKADEDESTGEKDMTSVILEHFETLTKIPRPSGHEEKISAYLLSWAKDKGFEAEADDLMNVIVDVPATEGMESRPKVALQGHMDMVFAQADGMNLDPLTTEIVSKNDGKLLTSDGMTSLGADDGIGIAIAMCVAEGYMAHGPLRLFFTVSEETDQHGAAGIDPKYFKDLDYLINIDEENEGYATVSCAGGKVDEFTMSCRNTEVSKNTALSIDLSGLKGGHSGVDIDLGRLNAIVAVASMLDSLRSSGVSFEVASFKGGDAQNAIPADATAVICIDEKNVDTVKDWCSAYLDGLKAAYGKAEPDMKLRIEKTDLPERVMSADGSDRMLKFISTVSNGVVSHSAYIPNLVVTSSNLGTIEADYSGFTSRDMLRSSDNEELESLQSDIKVVCGKYGVALELINDMVAWEYKEDNELQSVMEDAYDECFDAPLRCRAIHAGLECGLFAEKNADMGMIAIGPTIHNPHTVRETLEIDTIEKVWKLLEQTLAELVEYNVTSDAETAEEAGEEADAEKTETEEKAEARTDSVEDTKPETDKENKGLDKDMGVITGKL